MDKELYYDSIIGWLKCPKNTNLRGIREINLIYKGSRDGFLSKNFHFS